jgi:5-enolpyruvylshikimate-3-phosphate synthase
MRLPSFFVVTITSMNSFITTSSFHIPLKSDLSIMRVQGQMESGCITVLKATTETSSDLEILTLSPICSLDGTVTLPGSKSLSNRCLLLAALSEGDTLVENLLDSDDIRYMLQALDRLKVPVERKESFSSDTVLVHGQGGPIYSENKDETCELFLGNAGTAMRPLTAALSMGYGTFILDGVPRMRERPIADLVNGLQQLGAKVSCVSETGCPPVTIHANGLSGGTVCAQAAKTDISNLLACLNILHIISLRLFALGIH